LLAKCGLRDHVGATASRISGRAAREAGAAAGRWGLDVAMGRDIRAPRRGRRNLQFKP